MADEFKVTYAGSPSTFGPVHMEDYDILINATSVGFKSDQSVVEGTQMLPGKVVMDLVFTPPVETSILKQAKALECQVIEGYNVSLYQACYQFELYTGHEAPVEIMRSSLMDFIDK